MARHSFDLLLLDIELPDMNGLEVTKFIRNLAIPKKANIPIIALTGNTSDDDIKNYLDAGMNDFAAKPVTYEKIVEILNKVSQGSIAQQSISTPPIIVDFSDQDDESGYTPKQAEISPLSAYSASVQTNTEGSHSSSYIDGMSDIDLDDDDSFANAVRQFEELEKNSSITPPEQIDTKVDILEDLDSVGLDESILGSLKTGLSPSQFQEILVSYYEKVDELIVEIGKAYLEPNPIALYARAHELKGMAGNFGFAELSRMCAVIEKAAKDNQLEIAKNEVDRLGDHYAVARNFLNKWLLT
jgi:CheY-like chemotaxis protein